MTQPVVILGCGAQKRALDRGEQVEIVELYTGPLYRSRLAYARALGGPQYILSALHGLRRPYHLVTTYEHDLAKQPKRERARWADGVASDIELLVDRATPIVVLASGAYLGWIGKLTAWAAGRELAHYQITTPLEGMGIGAQRAWCVREAERIESSRVVVESRVERDDEPASDGGPTFEGHADEVERELPTWRDDEDVCMSVGALRVLLARATRRDAA